MDFEQARVNMVNSQLRTNKVTSEAVVEAFLSVPREKFVPKSRAPISYVDEDLSLDNGRFLMEPMVLARMLQYADIKKDDLVLDVGSATGYSSVIISRMASTVVALEEDNAMSSQSAQIFAELGADNAVSVTAPLKGGYAEQGPYNVIVLEGCVDSVPEALLEQLAEGGRLIAVIGKGVAESQFSGLIGSGIASVTLFVRNGGSVTATPIFDAAVPRLPGFIDEKEFVF